MKMKVKISFWSLFMVSCLSSSVFAQKEWKFKKETKGIKVYTRHVEGSNLKELKFTIILEAKLSTVVALLMDVDAYKDWVFKCSESKNLKMENGYTYDYYTVDFPWPLNDRELYSRAEISQDPVTKIVTTINKSVQTDAPLTDEYIRITTHVNKWIFKAISPNQVHATYFLRSEPAGNIPTWMVNLVIDQGPVKSMKKFRALIKLDKYINSAIDYNIIDFEEGDDTTIQEWNQ